MKQAIIIKTVEEIREAMPKIGTRKLKFLLDKKLQKHNIEIGRDKLFDLLFQYGLLIRRRKKRKAITTDSNHPFKKYPNLIRNLVPVYPNQLWVSDITYIAVSNNYCYLSLITDAYSRKIVGFCLYPTLQKEGPLRALQMALSSYQKVQGRLLVHHSDRGLQYCCREYIEILLANKISISMTENSDPYENAIAERINGILKVEFLLNKTFKTYDEALDAVKNSIAIYNDQWPHGSCDYLTPQEAHQKEGILQKRWKSKNEQIL